MPTWGMWAVLFGLVALRGLLSAMEAALYAISDSRAQALLEMHPRRGKRLLKLKADREATAASIRIGMVLSGFTAAALGSLVPPRLLSEQLARLPELTWASPLASALLVAVLASLADVVMRSLATAKPEPWALALSGLGMASLKVFAPPMRLLVAPFNVLLRPWGQRVSFTTPPPPLEDLEKLLVDKAQKLDKGAPALIRSIFEMSDKTVRDVMVSRTEVVAVDLATPPEEILRILAEEGHSRMPVYRGAVDTIVGILHVRDLVPLMEHRELLVLQDLIRPAVYVPWVKPIGDLLREMQRGKIHMAVVVDEYGGFMGIVTLEDILREIVGDIGDEFDEEEKLFEKQPDGSFLVDAALAPKELEKAFGLKLPEGDYETLGGYLSTVAGAIPEVNDRFVLGGWTLLVHSKQGPRLERVRLIKPRSPPAAAAEPGKLGELLPPRPSPVN